MTKKDFELIAETINKSRISQRDKEHVATMFAMRLGRENPRFDKAKFFSACVNEKAEV